MGEGFLLRVKYAKRGRLAYLSHLETIRSVERIIRRAQLPYAITEGFNPHMKIAFGPALPVGAGGEGEYADVRMREYVPAAQALQRLQSCAAPSLYPLSCDYIDVRADAITVMYPVSAWVAEFADARMARPAEDLAAELLRAFDMLLEVGHIEVVRRNKKPRLVSFEGRLVARPEFEVRSGKVCCAFRTCDRGEGALRPDKFIDAALALMPNPPNMVKLTRTALLEDSSPANA